MPDSTIMGVVVLFIGIVILIGLTPIILGNTVQDCSSLDGYDPNSDGTLTDSTGWAATCLDSNETNQDSFNVILVIPVVVAAVAILMVVRFL